MVKCCALTNLIAWLLKLGLTYFFAFGYGGGYSLVQQSEYYQNLLTPVPFVHYIWMAIYYFELLFIIHQFLPCSDIGRKEVSLWWIFTCINESLAVISICYDYILLSVLFHTLLVISCYVLYLYANKYKTSIVRTDGRVDRAKLASYLFFYLPTAIHLAWVTIVLVQCMNILSVYFSNIYTPEDTSINARATGVLCQFATALISLCVLSSYGSVHSFTDDPDPIIGLVVSWYTCGVYASLRRPHLSLIVTFNEWWFLVCGTLSHVLLLISIVFFILGIHSVCVCVYKMFYKNKQQISDITNPILDRRADTQTDTHGWTHMSGWTHAHPAHTQECVTIA
eukprot:GHVR01156402.1.p1 GENE.GHVR01156402.1~~GHVR01156402.1.p1  ORF type:complete len:338 (+),score=75.66 GHVR01156402.1:54-1067(+)